MKPHSDEVWSRYVDLLAQAYRDTKWNLTVHLMDGWTPEQHRRWVETGNSPELRTSHEG